LLEKHELDIVLPLVNNALYIPEVFVIVGVGVIVGVWVAVGVSPVVTVGVGVFVGVKVGVGVGQAPLTINGYVVSLPEKYIK